MKNRAYSLLTTIMVLTSPSLLLANWNQEIRNVNSVKHLNQDDRIVVVQGQINRLLENKGFALTDSSGEIRIKLESESLQNHDFHYGMKIEVMGRVEYEHGYWDLKAIEIKLPDGKIIS